MFLLFDIGGTHIRYATSSDGTKLENIQKLDTPKQYSETLKLFKQIKSEQKHSIQKISVGIAGILYKNKSLLFKSPNLPSWDGKNLKKDLENIFKRPAVLENDAALAGLAEARIGAGKGKEIVAYLTVSTGVGGARIVKGHIDTAGFGFEPGHQLIVLEEHLYPEQSSMEELEDLVSGTAILRKFGKKPEEITSIKFWQTISRRLAIGLHNTCLYWNPEVIVLGGAISPSLDLSVIQKILKKTLEIYPELPELKLAKLGDSAGLHGALLNLKP